MMHTNYGSPTPPIAFGDAAAPVSDHLVAQRCTVSEATVDQLRGACSRISVDTGELAEASRDWWPLAMHWALHNEVGGRAGVICAPATLAELVAVLQICNASTVPVTAAGGRSGVCGASIPVHGGVVLDMTGLSGIRDVDTSSMIVDVAAGTFGDVFEDSLRSEHNITCGHWPQSIALSTVGGWVACRGAGQLSTRYGKIEDMVVGLDVVLADGTQIHTGGVPRSAAGPDLNQLFIGSEGTLGIVTGVRLRAHPLPTYDRRAAFGFASFDAALDAMRSVMQRGATPAVLRLYDSIEADRSYKTGDRHLLLVLDEGDPIIVDATMTLIADACRDAEVLDSELVAQWMGHRNDVSQLQSLVSRDVVVDTMEISATWAALPRIYERTRAALLAVPDVMVASAHQSHSYTDGGCLYFTFAARPPVDQKDECYKAMWDAGTRAVLAEGGALSHHHGIGLNRARFMREALGTGFDVLAATKRALDPNGILNPGKLGLDSPWGEVAW